MLVGEAPGAEEDESGRPFVGRAGRLLDALLEKAGIARSDCYVTNVVKCRPPANRTPTQIEISGCATYLYNEIEDQQPKVIVCLGVTALKALTGKSAITRERGKVLQPRKGLYIDAPILATIHPAAALRPGGDAYREQIVNDLRIARSLTEQHRDDEHAHLIPPGMRDLEAIALLRPLADARILAVDCEWTAGSRMVWPWSKRGELYSIALTGRSNGDVYSCALAYPMPARVRGEVARLLATKPIVFHNAMADLLWLSSERFVCALAADTMLLAYLLDERQGRSLEAVASYYADGVVPGWKGDIRSTRPQMDHEWETLLRYNAEDTRATLLAFEGLLRAVKASPNSSKILKLHRFMLKTIPPLARSASFGIPIDLPLLRKEQAKSRKRRDDAQNDLASIIQETSEQAGRIAASPKGTKDLLRGLGVDIADSRKDHLAEIIEIPAVRAILHYRQEQKLLSTYLDPWNQLLTRQGDARLHTIYRITGTRTGRLSAESEEGGSIQVAPRDSASIAFRRLVCAPPGHKIITADYSQIELRVAAWLANEPTMRSFYQQGIDIHLATAAYLVACRERPMPMEEFWPRREEYMARVTKADRQGAKGVNFGLVYGMQPPKLRDYARLTYGVTMTIEEAQRVHESYFRLYARLPSWHAETMHDVIERGYTETPFGRRRTFDASNQHAAINTPVQATASDLTLLAMIAIDRRLRSEGTKARVIGTIHDSILIEAQDAHVDRASAILRQEMENVDTSDFGVHMPVPLVADLKAGQTWG